MEPFSTLTALTVRDLPLLIAGVGIEEVIVGLNLGSRLFLIAVGLSLIFGVLRVLNFAHGVFYMLGAYLVIATTQWVFDSFWLGVVVGALVVGIVGIAIEVVAIRPLYERPEGILDQLIVTFGFVLIIHDLTRSVWGSRPYRVQTPEALAFGVELFGTSVPAYRLFVIAAATGIMAALWLFLQRTHYGHLIRATSTDRDMAAMLGVDVPRLYTGVFFIGSVLAGIGGALAAPLQGISPGLGDQVIIDAFVIVVIGGLGSLSGAFVGAMLVGLMQSFGVLFIAGGDIAIPFLVMIFVLLVRPQGLFGEVES